MIWSLPILMAFAAGLPFLAERRKPDMDDELRSKAPGDFADLSDGKTHFQWAGPEDGPVLVCIHGLTTPSTVFRFLVPALAAQGYRVLSYDLYGRGFSDRPRGKQTRNFFIRQLRDLLQHQNLGGEITLIGYSMGGSIATVFAAEEPMRIRRLILLATAGLVHAPGPLAETARRVPLLGDWIMLSMGGAALLRGAQSQPGQSAVIAEQCRGQRDEVSRRGYLPAVLSSQRNMLAETLEEEHRALAAAGVPILAIWGEQDTVIPIRALGKLADLNRDVRHEVISGAGHGLAYTHPTDVLAAITADRELS